MLASVALGDGTETLGPPSVSVSSGTGAVVAGVGTELTQPGSGTISVTVPGTVRQVLLYWSGHYSLPNGGDPSILVGASAPAATAVNGTSIGGPSCFFSIGGINPCDPPGGTTSNYFQTYRADITGLGLVHSGSNSFAVGGLDFHANDGNLATDGNDGAGIVVIYDDGSASSSVAGLRDGQDLAFYRFPSPFDTTVAQTFSFTASTAARQAMLSTLASSVQGPSSGLTPQRPNQLQVTFDVGGSLTIQNPWASTSGSEFDAVNTTIAIPAGASSLTVQALSTFDPAHPEQIPASLNWIAAALSVPKAVLPPEGGTFTQGFWKNHPNAWPVQTIVLGTTTFTKDQGIALLKTEPKRGNATLILVHQLIAAELNVAGNAPSSCIASTITAANAWLAANGGANGYVSSGSAAGAVATGLAGTLDKYNNGKLCAKSGE